MPTETAIEPQPIAASALLQGKIAALKRKHVSVEALTGLSLIVVICLELLALAMFLDWWLDLPWAIRLLSLTAQLALFAYLLVRYVAVPYLRQPTEDGLALMMEKAKPAFRTRLISSLQLTRPGAVPPGASTAMVYALVQETEAFAAPMDFQQIVPTDRLKKLGVAAILIPILALAAFIATAQSSSVLLERVFLSQTPVPRKTRVIVLDGNHIIGLGDSVRLEALAKGVVPNSGRLTLNYRNRKNQEFLLDPSADDPSRFGRTIENIQDSFKYKIYLNDGVSATYNVQAIPRPTVDTIDCLQIYPAYSKLPPTQRALGDLSLLAGSRLKLTITGTKALKFGSLKLIGQDRELPLRVNDKAPQELLGELLIPATNLTGFSVQMLDTDGMESTDSAVYRVEIIPDKIPVVRIVSPLRKEELVTRTARPFIAYSATDDFALSQISLHYKTPIIAEGAPQVVELDLQGQEISLSQRQHQWNLGELTLTEGSVIEYWIEARDNNNVTGPGVGHSDNQFLRVVSPEEKLADIWNRAGDYMGSIDDLADDEEKLNRNLGEIILERTGPQR